ncbi:hypothetical protein [Arenicella sp. 4NH20-0111]|uniref:hypothetical protein n=1 Tax=Arenicella sp. 4NH20-0111 TaxID=3127648 RepID=UPI0033414E04
MMHVVASSCHKAIRILMALFVVMVLGLSVSSGAHSENNFESKLPKSASLRFTLSDELGFPQDQSKDSFDCLDKIYAVTDVKGFKKGKHIIEFRWVDPSGDTRERTVYDFFVRDKPSTKLWAWLELSRGQGAGVVQWLNPAAGLEEFIGKWELKLLIDDKEFKSDEFDVNC